MTGGTGMIGANLVPRLIADGYQVSMLVRPSSSLIRLKFVEKQVKFLYGDITDGDSLRAIVDESQPQVVFHLASTRLNPPSITAEEHLSVNVMGTQNLLDALKDSAGVKFIYTGSIAAYGAGSQLREDGPLLPGTLLGASKACASIILEANSRLHGTETVELRLCTLFGPWESPGRLIPQAILSAIDGQDLPMSEGNQERDFVYMGDVVDALMLCISGSFPPGSVFNIGSSVGVPVKTVAQRVLELMDNPSKILLGALETRPDEIMEMSADISAARDRLGWQPATSLDEGLRKSITWFTENQEIALQLQ